MITHMFFKEIMLQVQFIIIGVENEHEKVLITVEQVLVRFQCCLTLLVTLVGLKLTCCLTVGLSAKIYEAGGCQQKMLTIYC